MLLCRHFWLLLSWLYLILIVILSLIPIASTVAISITYVDKIEHFIGYFILMFLFAMCYSNNTSKKRYAASFILLGVIIEVLQDQTVFRQFEYADMLANTIGILFALYLSDSKLRNIFLKVDNLLNRLLNRC